MLEVDGILLAGAPNDGPLREIDPVSHEALIRVGGRPMFLYVLEALLAAGVRRVVIVGPPELEEPTGWPEGVLRVDPAGSLIANVFCGLEALGGHRPVLVATADIPLLSKEAVEGFLEECRKTLGEFITPSSPGHHGEELSSPSAYLLHPAGGQLHRGQLGALAAACRGRF